MKDPKSNRWSPPQKMPLEFFVTADGGFLYTASQGSTKGLNKEGVLQLANDAETLAKELREAADLMEKIQNVKQKANL